MRNVPSGPNIARLGIQPKAASHLEVSRGEINVALARSAAVLFSELVLPLTGRSAFAQGIGNCMMFVHPWASEYCLACPFRTAQNHVRALFCGETRPRSDHDSTA